MNSINKFFLYLEMTSRFSATSAAENSRATHPYGATKSCTPARKTINVKRVGLRLLKLYI